MVVACYNGVVSFFVFLYRSEIQMPFFFGHYIPTDTHVPMNDYYVGVGVSISKVSVFTDEIRRSRVRIPISSVRKDSVPT